MTINSMATSQLQTSMFRLSTMQRINSARDDAAGLAIANAIETQVRGLDVGTRNTLDMQNLVNTAEGGISTISDAIQRMRELTIQASSGIMTDEQRQLIQHEVSQLADHVNMAARTTQFNGMNLLDGSFTNAHTASDAMGRGATVSIPDMSAIGLGLQNFNVFRAGRGDGSVDPSTTAARVQALGQQLMHDEQVLATRNEELTAARETFSTATTNFVQTETAFNRAQTDYNASRENLNDALMNAGFADLRSMVNAVTTTDGEVDLSRLSDAAVSGLRGALQEYNRSAIELGSDTMGLAALTDNRATGALEALGVGGAGQPAQITADQVNHGRGAPGATRGANEALVGQIGAFEEARDNFAMAQAQFDSAVFARDQAMNNVTNTQALVRESSANLSAAFGNSDLSILDNAMAQVNRARASLGALSNRFDHTVASNNVSMLNQAAARSRIADLDVAREVTALRRAQILQQYQIFNQRNQQEALTTRMLSLLG
jgi:flagellin